MKISSLTVLHYGREWLEWALRSVELVVDEAHIFYTPHPSHGTQTKARCPDTREELRAIADMFPFTRWHDTEGLFQEGPQRDYARDFVIEQGAQLILVLDADEVWDPDDLDSALAQAWNGKAQSCKSRIKGNAWKSVNWMCYDELMPDRILKPSGTEQYAYLDSPGFWHFGYAVSHEIMIYKLKIHGHHNELRLGWYPEIYRDWQPGNVYECGVHPTNTCNDKTGAPFWTPVEFDRDRIDYLIGDHPYFKDGLI